ncbi:MAG: ABC transporter permease [Fimbriimonadales bacterium]|nr:ABC transporter permease [Fimbriimonadales bacterium]
MAKVALLTRSWLRDWGRYVVGTFTQVWGNPVVGREARVRVRLSRSYFLQSLYLGFMILIVMLVYQNVVSDEVMRNPFEAQQSLQAFHATVMGTLTALIVLIAPALTANAITLERERRTMDLLAATPLTARQLLTGKLLGSLGFVLLLLALTLPVSGVSLLMGGATIREMLETYVLIAASAMVLCALALFSSAYARNSTTAVFLSYLRVGLLVVVLGIMTIAQATTRLVPAPGATGRELLLPLCALSPFSAPYVADTVFNAFGLEIPGVVVGVLVCLLATRMLLTGAAPKVGLYDKDTLPSLRRQMLLAVFLASWLSFAPPVQHLIAAGGIGHGGGFGITDILPLVGFALPAPMPLLILFLAPYGGQEERRVVWNRRIRVRDMLTGKPSGSLPYILSLWFAAIAGLALAMQPLFVLFSPEVWAYLVTLLFYYTGLWVFLWACAQLCSALLKGRSVAAARWLTLGCYAVLFLLPPILHMTLFSDMFMRESPAFYLSVVYPVWGMIDTPAQRVWEVAPAFYLYGAVLWLLSLLLYVLHPRHTNQEGDVS